MVLVFLIYGFSFFVLAISILIYPKKGSQFQLARRLWLIAGFGFTHGTNEWVDMFMLIRQGQDNQALEILHLALLPLSFLFLVWFGVLMITDLRSRLKWLKVLPAPLVLSWGVIFVLSEDRFLMGDIFSRYLLCVPGVILTSYALLLHIPVFAKTRFRDVGYHLTLAAFTFMGYGVFGGVVVHGADFFPASVLNYENFQAVAGFPVQILRAICALINAYCMGRVLGIFHWESRTALDESEMRFQSIVETAPIILFMEDLDDEITYIKGKGLKALDLEPAELLGKGITELFPDVPPVAVARERALEGQDSFFQFCTQGITFEMRISALVNDCGIITGLMGIAADISEQEKERSEKEKYREEISKNKRLVELGIISSKMMKEIDEPLSVSHLLMERLLTEYGKSTDQATMGDTIKKSFTEISKASSILERFGMSAQIGTKQKAGPVDLYQVGRRMIEVFANSALNARLRIALRDMDRVVYLSMPERELEQIFFILIQNAVDAADRKQCEDLTVSCEAEDDHIILHFNDTCCGIPAERMGKIFEAYNAEKFGANGSGMGLAVARHLVSSYGGKIEVDSEVGKGSTFRVRLPVDRIS